MLRSDALFRLGEALRAEGYAFVTPTPATHGRVNARNAARPAENLRDVFGWSRSFTAGALPPAIASLAESAGVLITADPAAAPTVDELDRGQALGALATGSLALVLCWLVLVLVVLVLGLRDGVSPSATATATWAS